MRKNPLVALALTVVLAACGSAPTAAPPTPGEPVALATTSPATSASPTIAQSPSPTATATASPTATPTLTPAPTPPPWKTYRSKRNHYRIKYPPNWIVTPGSSKLADQFDDSVDHYVYVSRDVVSGGSTGSISLTVSHDIATYKSHFKAKLLSNTSISLQGYAGRMLVFNGVSNGLKVYIQHIILGKGSTGYFITMFSDRTTAKADKALFKKIYRTWKPT